MTLTRATVLTAFLSLITRHLSLRFYYRIAPDGHAIGPRREKSWIIMPQFKTGQPSSASMRSIWASSAGDDRWDARRQLRPDVWLTDFMTEGSLISRRVCHFQNYLA
jgi:hypothetical protein